MPIVINHKSRCPHCGWEGLSSADRTERILKALWALGVLGVGVYGGWADAGFEAVRPLWPVALIFVVVSFVVPPLIRRREPCGKCQQVGLARVRE